MKLLTKTSLVYLLTTLLVFAAGGWIFYNSLRHAVDEETTEDLYVEKERVLNWVEAHGSLPVVFYAGDLDQFREASSVQERLSDTTAFSKEEGEYLPYRRLIFPVAAEGKTYEVTLGKPLFEADDLVESILTSFCIIIAILLLITLVVNRITAWKIMKPFFHTMRQLGQYEIGRRKKLLFLRTTTSEFRQLQSALEQMTEKIETDYLSLKAFTENASHEMQTPLSVIMTTAESLLQHERLDEKQAEALRRIYDSARRLSKLNHALLLLAKIENKQFVTETIDLGELVRTKAALYHDLLAMKTLQPDLRLEENITLQLHPMLADILVSNLLVNAIRHSPAGGQIIVETAPHRFTVRNSGPPLRAAGEQLFERFYKENPSSESTGLGLALVKQIAVTHGMEAAYRYENEQHCFEVRF